METSGENQKVGNTFQIKKEAQIKHFNIVCSLLSPKDQHSSECVKQLKPAPPHVTAHCVFVLFHHSLQVHIIHA